MLHALHYHSSGFFIIMSPAEGLHFSALVRIVFYLNFLSITVSLVSSLRFLCSGHCLEQFIMPRCACASKVYGSVFVCVCVSVCVSV